MKTNLDKVPPSSKRRKSFVWWWQAYPRLAAALGLLALLAAVHSVFGQSRNEPFEASGTLTRVDKDNELLEHEFSIRVNGAKWVITSSSGTGRGSPERRCGSDGASFYSLAGVKGRSSPSGWKSTIWRTALGVLSKGGGPKALPHDAEVRPGRFPEFDWRHQTHLIWLVLGSREIFQGKDEMHLPGGIFLLRTPHQTKDLVRIRYDEADSSFVTHLEVVDPMLESIASSRTSLSDLATRAKYRVISTKVLGELRIPEEFELIQFGTKWIGKVTMVKPLKGEEDGIPKFGEILEVTDYRAVPAIHYKTSRGWLQPSDKRFKNLVLGKGGYEEGLSGLRPFFIYLGAAIGFLLALRRLGGMLARRLSNRSKD